MPPSDEPSQKFERHRRSKHARSKVAARPILLWIRREILFRSIGSNLASGEMNLEISSPLLLPQEEKGPGDEEVGAGYAMECPRPFLQAPTPNLYAR